MSEQNVCSGCGGTDAVEWKLVMAWRHDRAKTGGTRYIDAHRDVKEEHLCNYCAQLVKNGHVPQGRLL